MLTTYDSILQKYISSVKLLTGPTITTPMQSNCLVRANKKREITK